MDPKVADTRDEKAKAIADAEKRTLESLNHAKCLHIAEIQSMQSQFEREIELMKMAHKQVRLNSNYSTKRNNFGTLAPFSPPLITWLDEFVLII